MEDKIKLTEYIKAKANNLGFFACGISEACSLPAEGVFLESWTASKKNAGMAYFENNKEKRVDPRLLVEGTVSVISLLYPYYPHNLLGDSSPKIAKYAYGVDYHYVVKEKLSELFDAFKSVCPAADGRFFIDSAPVLDKVWAQRAGLGWIGKNSLLINKQKGSFFFIGEILLNKDLVYDKHEVKEYCGNCTRCVDACPTDALLPERTVDSNKCISYLNKDHKGEVGDDLLNKFSGWVFGCDICQDVCPWNKSPLLHNDDSFLLKPEIAEMEAEDWEGIDKKTFNKLFKNSGVKRMGLERFKRNIALWHKKQFGND